LHPLPSLTFPSFDSIINTYLIDHCGLHPPSSPQYALAVHSHADFFSSIAYPAVADLGVRVVKLGKSSVTYEVALFEQGVKEVKAVAEFVHVFVERSTGRPAKDGMAQAMRAGLEKIYTKATTTSSKL
jgi:acyl-CoA thioester hydrolase